MGKQTGSQMIRQARIYLASAVSGTTVIVAALIAFVVLVSLQTLRDWPLSGLGGDSQSAVRRPAGVDRTAAGEQATPGVPAGRATGGPQAPQSQGGGSGDTAQGAPAVGAPDAARPGGGPPPTDSHPYPTGGGAGSFGSATRSVDRGGARAGNGSGAESSPAGAVGGAVEDTVAGVDEASGGALSGAGLTGVGQGAAEGVDETSAAAGDGVDTGTAADGLLGGGG